MTPGIDFYVLAEKFIGSLDDSDTSLPPRPMDVKALEQLLAEVYNQGIDDALRKVEMRVGILEGTLKDACPCGAYKGARRNSEKVLDGD